MAEEKKPQAPGAKVKEISDSELDKVSGGPKYVQIDSKKETPEQI